MHPSTPNTWTRTAIEYAVMTALNIHGYKDIPPSSGYSRHSCMVPDPSCQDSSNPDFCDFTVISTPALFEHYVRKALKTRRIKLNQPDKESPLAELTQGSFVVQDNTTNNFYHNACLAILKWFEVKTVPMAIHYFEDELAEHLSVEAQSA